MTYFRRVVIVQNDYGRDLQMQITDDQDNAFDLSGCSCTISVREKSNSFNIISSQICTITSEDEGTLKYTIQSGDLMSAGVYEVQVEINRSGSVITAKGLTIVVVEEFE